MIGLFDPRIFDPKIFDTAVRLVVLPEEYIRWPGKRYSFLNNGIVQTLVRGQIYNRSMLINSRFQHRLSRYVVEV